MTTDVDATLIQSRIIEDVELILEKETDAVYLVYQWFHQSGTTSDVSVFDSEEKARLFFSFFDQLIETMKTESGL